MLEIHIKTQTGTKILDLAPDTVLETESPTDAFDEDFTVSDFSLPITVPWTDNNRKILGFAERLANYSSTPGYWECDVYDNGYPEILGGKFFLLSKAGLLNYSSGSFSANITGARGLFGARLKKKKLKDLNFGAPIQFPAGVSSRAFATDVGKGIYPQLDFMSFAPIVFEDFFNENNAEYNGEFLAEDTVNNQVATGLGPNDWEFGRTSPTSSSTALAPGTEEYIHYRTIPFFKLRWVLTKVMENLGYQLEGGIMDDEAADNVFLFNNLAIEKYNLATYTDINQEINPVNHLPDMEVTEFLRRAFFFYNIYPTFPEANKIVLKQRNTYLQLRRYTDITSRCLNTFNSAYRDAADGRGYVLDYEHDGEDGYFGEHVKELEGKKLVATVNLKPELNALTFPFALDTNSIAFVTAENMYYSVADATVIPVVWEVFTENLLPQKVGEGTRQVSLGMDTLCQHITLIAELQTATNKLATRQAGSYYTNSGSFVASPFGLRVFFIRNLSAEGKQWPVSHNHHTDKNGLLIEPRSLSIQGNKGMGELHQTWQNSKDGLETHTLKITFDKKLQSQMQTDNKLMLDNIALIPTSTRRSIPAGNTVEVDVIAVS